MSLSMGAAAAIAAGAAATGSVASSTISSGANRHSQKRAFRYNTALQEQAFGYNRQLAEEAYNRNVAQWMRENDYNSPSAQMQRFKEAGLNPNLIYGQGSNGNASGSPQFETPYYSPPEYPTLKPFDVGIDGAIQSAMSIAQAKLQMDNLKAQNAVIGAQARALNARATGDEISNLYSAPYLKYRNMQSLGKALFDYDSYGQRMSNLQYRGTRDMRAGNILRYQEELWSKGINPNTPQSDVELYKFLDGLVGENSAITRFLGKQGTSLFNSFLKSLISK